jgi:hypothetical protein
MRGSLRSLSFAISVAFAISANAAPAGDVAGRVKALNDLLKLRAAKRKEQIGFESQQRAERDDKRKQERHQWDILLAEAKVDGQQLRDLNHDIKESERLRAYVNSLKAA